MSKKYFYSYFIVLILLSYFISINSINNSSESLTWPTGDYKTITSYFGFRIHPITFKESYHSGIDISAPEGTDIVSICDGEVILTDFNGAYGYSIVIKSQSYEILYGHVSPDFIVSVGDFVFKGTIIAEVGPKYVDDSPYSDSNRKSY